MTPPVTVQPLLVLKGLLAVRAAEVSECEMLGQLFGLDVLVAERAVRSVGGVRPHVLLGAVGLREAFPAEQTGEGFVPSVRVHVVFQVTFEREALPADPTLVRPLPAVHGRNVPSQIRLVPEAVAALLAAERLDGFSAEGGRVQNALLHVGLQVLLQTPLVLETLRTHGADVVHASPVLGQTRFPDKAFIADGADERFFSRVGFRVGDQVEF